jgi:hypothetical protein
MVKTREWTTFGDLSKPYSRALKRYRNYHDCTDNGLRRRMDWKAPVPKLPPWIGRLVQPLADALTERTGRTADVLGPFGLCCATSIHLYSDPELKSPARFLNGNCRSITFVPLDLDRGELGIRDYSRNTGEFRPGTIGEMNGMNHPTIPVPDDADLDWFVERLS